MEQRRLRLGDIVDDYCPRERRVTNHAIVAMVEEDVKQTRCTTCDADHAYKGGRAPRGRKKDSTGALYKEVLAGINEGDTPPMLAPPPVPAAAAVASGDLPPSRHASSNGGSDPGDHVADGESRDDDAAPPSDGPLEDGPVHRQLIRATLPRLEGHKEVRQATDFTIRQSNGRGANFQHNQGGGDQRARARGGQGQPSNRPPGAASRFAGARPPHPSRGSGGRPPGGGFRGGQPPRRGGSDAGGGGRKRSR